MNLINAIKTIKMDSSILLLPSYLKTHPEYFKVGNIIKILNKPFNTSSYFGPMTSFLDFSYPYTFKIIKIEYVESETGYYPHPHWAVWDGFYSWDLGSILEAGAVLIYQQESDMSEKGFEIFPFKVYKKNKK